VHIHKTSFFRRACSSGFIPKKIHTIKKDKVLVVKLIEKYLGFFDNLAEIMISPENTFKKILDGNAALKGIYIFIFFAAFLGIMLGAMIAGAIKMPFLPILMAIIAIIIGLIKILIWAGISHMVAKFAFKGEGSFSNLFGLFGFTSVSYILWIFGIMTIMLATTIFSSALLFVVMLFWMLIIAVAAVNAEHKIGMGKSFLSCFGVPSLVIIAILLILGV
jgi:hypothetical protein